MSGVAGQIQVALDKSETAWRSLDSLAREIGASPEDTRGALRHLGSQVRRPVGASGPERDWYRLASKGLTWQEHWRLLRAALGRTSPGIECTDRPDRRDERAA